MISGADITFAPALAWPALAALGLAAGLTLGFALWRRAVGLWWRALGITALLLALANPTLISEDRQPLNDVVAVVVDHSASQRIGERPAVRAAALERVRNALAVFDDLDVRVIEAGDGDQDQGTLLFAARDRALSDTPRRRIAGTILITDGQVHDPPPGPSPDGGPVHVLLTGRKNERDRRLIVETAPHYGMVGGAVALRLRVDDDDVGAAARVSLRQDGGRTHYLDMRTGRAEDIPLRIEHGGPTIIEIEVAAADDELTLANNRAVLIVNGIRDRLRVLLVSGEPHPGQRTWRALLKADPSVDLVHFTILRPPEKQDGTSVRNLSLIAFPVRELFEVKLNEFDLVIFDRYRRRWLLPGIYLQNIADYVLGGGAVFEAAGPSFASALSLYRTALGQVLPGSPTGRVIEEPYRPTLTEKGVRHPVTGELVGAGTAGSASGPSWGRWFRLIEARATTGTVLMTGPGERPLLVLSRVGEGRVAQLLSDHGWLWARGYDGGGPQAELLRRIAHWLMKEPDLEENDLRAHAVGGRLEIARRSLEPDDRPVRVTAPSGAVTEVALDPGPAGRDTATVRADEAGLYHVDDGVRRAVAAAGALNPIEAADVRASAAILSPIVDATGGAVHWLEDGMPTLRRVGPEEDAAGPGWIGLRANGAYVVERLRQFPLLPALLVLLLALGGSVAAWHREGR